MVVSIVPSIRWCLIIYTCTVMVLHCWNCSLLLTMMRWFRFIIVIHWLLSWWHYVALSWWHYYPLFCSSLIWHCDAVHSLLWVFIVVSIVNVDDIGIVMVHSLMLLLLLWYCLTVVWYGILCVIDVIPFLMSSVLLLLYSVIPSVILVLFVIYWWCYIVVDDVVVVIVLLTCCWYMMTFFIVFDIIIILFDICIVHYCSSIMHLLLVYLLCLIWCCCCSFLFDTDAYLFLFALEVCITLFLHLLIMYDECCGIISSWCLY